MFWEYINGKLFAVLAEKGTRERMEKKGGDRDKNGRGVWDKK
jgi:hypothetical protein